ncbi:hypothetical protein D0Q02_21235 [Micromonospora craniellae]|uniref:Uncharacterized protein n=1 Tax=Micromonospora craniellae TaxID=2294034 RepID=A0A372FV09_9ACTN|nr:hypothetical protein D0Q02_21235 [Micromonospora craniellae]
MLGHDAKETSRLHLPLLGRPPARPPGDHPLAPDRPLGLTADSVSMSPDRTALQPAGDLPQRSGAGSLPDPQRTLASPAARIRHGRGRLRPEDAYHITDAGHAPYRPGSHRPRGERTALRPLLPSPPEGLGRSRGLVPR